MANIVDATAQVSITVAAQGLGDLEIILSAPGGTVAPGTQVTVKAGVSNKGSGTDTMWCALYANGAVFGNTLFYDMPVGTGVHYFEWTYIVNTTTTFSADCGHMVGAIQQLDHSHTTSPTYTTSVTQYAEALFVGAPTYSPGQIVEPGTDVTISYQVQNTGYAGLVWGGLYDTVTPTPNLIGGYFEENFTAGQTKTKTVTITVNGAVQAQLLCGHIE